MYKSIYEKNWAFWLSFSMILVWIRYYLLMKMPCPWYPSHWIVYSFTWYPPLCSRWPKRWWLIMVVILTTRQIRMSNPITIPILVWKKVTIASRNGLTGETNVLNQAFSFSRSVGWESLCNVTSGDCSFVSLCCDVVCSVLILCKGIRI